MLLKLALISAISFACLLVGSAVTCTVISGVESIAFAPIFALFGWFLIFPIFGLVAGMWKLHGSLTRLSLGRRFFIPAGCLVGGAAMASLVILGWGSDPQMYWGLVLGGTLAGGLAASAIAVFRRYAA